MNTVWTNSHAHKMASKVILFQGNITANMHLVKYKNFIYAEQWQWNSWQKFLFSNNVDRKSGSVGRGLHGTWAESR